MHTILIKEGSLQNTECVLHPSSLQEVGGRAVLEVAALEVGVSLRRKGRGGGEGLGGRWHLSQEEEIRLGEVEGRVRGAHGSSFLLMELLTGLQVKKFQATFKKYAIYYTIEELAVTRFLVI